MIKPLTCGHSDGKNEIIDRMNAMSFLCMAGLMFRDVVRSWITGRELKVKLLILHIQRKTDKSVWVSD